jgi:vesicle-associated membrane protein-associated protein A
MTRSQALVLDPPNQLTFTGPFDGVVTVQLRLSNPTDRRVCFKVKTNVPHQYCVHPSVALIEPLQHVNVDVMLQPCSAAQPDADCGHKFMLLSIFAPDGDIASLERLWHQTKQDDVMNTKLSCVFNHPISRRSLMDAVCNGNAQEEISRQQLPHQSASPDNNVTALTPSEGLPTSVLILLFVAILAVVYKFLL